MQQMLQNTDEVLTKNSNVKESWYCMGFREKPWWIIKPNKMEESDTMEGFRKVRLVKLKVT